MEGYLTTQDIALRLGVKVATVRHWVRQGKLPGLSLGRAGYRISEAAYKAFVQRDTSSRRQPDTVELPFTGPSFLPLLEAITDSFVVVDPQGRYLYLNEAACRTLGHFRSDLVGKVMWQVFPALVGSPLHLAFQQAVTSGQPVSSEYPSALTGRWLNAHLYPSSAWVSIFFTDITELKQGQDTLASLVAIVDSSQDAIIGKTLEGIITNWNAAAVRLYGYEATEVLGRSITLIIPEDRHAEFAQLMERLRQGERIDSLDTVRRRKDGTLVPVSLTLSPVRNPQGKLIGASSIARDISEHKRLERLRDEFLAMASHELRTPLTSLKGFTALLARRLQAAADESSLAYLARMEAQINRLASLVEDLLDFSRFQLGSSLYQDELVDLAAIVREDIELAQATTSKRLQLEEAVEGASLPVLGDRARLAQVFYILIANAIKYSPQSDRVVIRLCTREHQAIVQVQDFGIGIAHEYHYQIFERYFQVPDPVVKTFPGMGIGLYLASEIIKHHHGSIAVESQLGEGATFTVQLSLVSTAMLKTAQPEERSAFQHEQ